MDLACVLYHAFADVLTNEQDCLDSGEGLASHDETHLSLRSAVVNAPSDADDLTLVRLADILDGNVMPLLALLFRHLGSAHLEIAELMSAWVVGVLNELLVGHWCLLDSSLCGLLFCVESLLLFLLSLTLLGCLLDDFVLLVACVLVGWLLFFLLGFHFCAEVSAHVY
jgi:hypothetical protein